MEEFALENYDLVVFLAYALNLVYIIYTNSSMIYEFD